MIRYRIATGAAALALAFFGVIGTGAAVASAASSNHICEESSQSLCLFSEGLSKQLHVQKTGSLTNFSAINAGGPGGVYFEYEQAGTKNCIAHVGGNVEMAACKAGATTQLWKVSGAELVNDSGGECMGAPNLFTIVETCGGPSDTWAGTA
jgi:hypothetical protein